MTGQVAIVAGLDSSIDVPNATSAAEARAAGVRLWNGYLPLPGAYSARFDLWQHNNFATARTVGDSIAFAFGTADPVQARELAAEWDVQLCLDVEPPRDNGPWVGDWLRVSGAGLYGLRPTLEQWKGHMPFAILAAYPGHDPATNDPGLDLGVPTGWQWEGTHTEFGCSVDRGWYDARMVRSLMPGQSWEITVGNSGDPEAFWVNPGTKPWAGIGTIYWNTPRPGSALWGTVKNGSGGNEWYANEIAAYLSRLTGVTVTADFLASINGGNDFPSPGSAYAVGSLGRGIGH